MAVKNCFIRGSVVRYVQLPAEHVDTQLLEDATRRGAPLLIHPVEPLLKLGDIGRGCRTEQAMTFGMDLRGTIGDEMSVEGSCRCARAVVYFISHATTGFPIIIGLASSSDALPKIPFSMVNIQTSPANRSRA